MYFLNQHDQQDGRVKHQAMILAQNVDSAEKFEEAYNKIATEGDVCAVYISGSSQSVLDKFEKEHEVRTLTVIGRLREGFDNKNVSVVAILRNVARDSKVFFTQFVGRAVRKTYKDDPVTAMIVSHERFHQRENFIQFDHITEEENVDEDECGDESGDVDESMDVQD